MYERPEKRARLTLLEDSDPRIDVFDEVLWLLPSHSLACTTQCSR
jgi:hypothetical protein